MSIRRKSLGLLLLAFLAGGGEALAQDSFGMSGDRVIDLNDTASDVLSRGKWIWGVLIDGMLSNGVTVAVPDAGSSSTFYAGGVGFLAVSADSGASWNEGFVFSHTEGDGADENGVESVAQLDSSRVAASRREFIRQEIVDKFGSEEYADSILDKIADSDLAEAEMISDIEELEALDLDMDPDLSKIPVEGESEASDFEFLSDFETYPERYQSLVRRGADPDVALAVAGDCGVVWQVVSTPSATYAVTSDAVYQTKDRGENWTQLVTAEFGESFLSVTAAEGGRAIVVGTTEGVMVTLDGGESWEGGHGIGGGVFQVYFMADGSRVLAVTPERLYESSDSGTHWIEVETPLLEGAILMDVSPGSGSRMMVLTSDDLYRVNGADWQVVLDLPFGDETIRQVEAGKPDLSQYVVRTDAHVYVYDGGWIDQNQALFANGLTRFSYLSDGVSQGMMGSPAGLWIAQDETVVKGSPEYQSLKERWEREPSSAEVIAQAFEAHYLGDFLEKRWNLRSYLSWMLPRVDFDFIYRQERTDDHKIVTNAVTGIDEKNSWTRKRLTRTEWQIMAHWDIKLDRYEAEEMSLESMLAGLRDERYALVRKVITELNKRHALEMTLMLDLPRLPEKANASQIRSLTRKQIKARLAIAEAESHLNYLTGGFYIPAIRNANP